MSTFNKYICDICGFIYDEKLGLPELGILEGTRFDDIPDDWLCIICGEKKSDFSLIKPDSVSENSTFESMDSNREIVVVVGGGFAAWAAIEGLRGEGYKGNIMMISRDSADVYWKPSLSTAFSEKLDQDNMVLQLGSDKAGAHNILLKANTLVMGLDTRSKKIITDKGVFPYTTLIIATGSCTALAKKYKQPNIHTVNSLAEYASFRSSISSDQRIMIVGGGLVGCELADDLSSNDFNLTMVNPHPHILSSLLPEPVSIDLANHLSAAGVEIINNSTVEAIDPQPNGVLSCQLSDQIVMDVDTVLFCIGTKAVSHLCHLAGIKTNNMGICVDSFMRTSDEDIYALGDCVEMHGLALKYIDPIRAQAHVLSKYIANHGHSELHYSPEKTLTKIKTTSYPIWRYDLSPSKIFDSWEIVQKNTSGMQVALFLKGEKVGEVFTGSYVETTAADCQPVYTKEIVKRQPASTSTEYD